MQSLRERLIQEGTIFPGASGENIIDKLNKKIAGFIDLVPDLQNEMRKSYLDYAMSVIVRRAIDSLSEYESESLGKKIRCYWVLRFSLLINKLDKFINSTCGELRAINQSTLLVRNGFYSPLKENMKNTP